MVVQGAYLSQQDLRLRGITVALTLSYIIKIFITKQYGVLG